MRPLLTTWLLGTCLLLAGCGVSRPAPTPARPRPPAGSPAPVTGAGSVFVVVMENLSYSEALQLPYVGELAGRYAVATDYHAISHPSLPNYLALTSGSTHGITDDGYHALPAGGLGDQLSRAGVSWRAYMESMTAGCMGSPYPYLRKHNPFAYYGGACPGNVVPFDRLGQDLAGATPRFAWITPNACNDGHDCAPTQADGYLRGLVPMITGSPAWQRGGVLFIVWDEAESERADPGNQVAALVVAPDLKAHQTAAPHDHYSVLRTVEDRLGVAPLGAAAQAQPFSELLPSA